MNPWSSENPVNRCHNTAAALCTHQSRAPILPVHVAHAANKQRGPRTPPLPAEDKYETGRAGSGTERTTERLPLWHNSSGCSHGGDAPAPPPPGCPGCKTRVSVTVGSSTHCHRGQQTTAAAATALAGASDPDLSHFYNTLKLPFPADVLGRGQLLHRPILPFAAQPGTYFIKTCFQNVGDIDKCCPVEMIRNAVRLCLTLDVLDPECEGDDVEGGLNMWR